MFLSLIAPIFYVIAAILIIIHMSNTIKNIEKKVDDYTSTIESYAANENDVIEDLSEKIANLEAYVTDFELKMITLRNEIRVKKVKKPSTAKKKTEA